jgi:hypothetical protein
VRLGAILVLIVPLVFGGGAALGELLTRPAWAEANATLSRVTDRAAALIGGPAAEALPADTAPEAPGGLMDRLSDMVSGTGEAVGDAARMTRDYGSAAGYFLSEADAFFEAALVILAVFLLRTLALPLVLFWAAYRLVMAGLRQGGQELSGPARP